jgi:hypothetical protein
VALKGTLKDFGIADILQLIGQQQKTGLLHLKAKEQEVHIGFKDGNIVRAESTTRKRKDLIGNMLVRAELITEQQLQSALETQTRTLKRLGDVLVSSRFITQERFKQMVQLQATETLYRLFMWKSGTYAFEQVPVDFDAEAMTPLRAETVLMEGFRMVDEWPVIKRLITTYEMTFEKMKPLPPPVAQADDFDDAFDEFAEKKKDENKGEFKSIGDSERKVYDLIGPGRDVRRLIDLSCLGEFETCKALTNLCNLDYCKAISARGPSHRLDEGEGVLARAATAAQRVTGTVALVGLAVFVLFQLDLTRLSGQPTSSYADPAAHRFVSRSQLSRIEAALEVYRLESGKVPEKLEVLVSAGLLEEDDLRYPWREPYYYRPTSEREFILLPPLR